MNGRRVEGKEPHQFEPGDYGIWPRTREWYARTPNGLLANLSQHNIIGNEDGTITVKPSILVTRGDVARWHGYLERGVWRETP